MNTLVILSSVLLIFSPILVDSQPEYVPTIVGCAGSACDPCNNYTSCFDCTNHGYYYYSHTCYWCAAELSCKSSTTCKYYTTQAYSYCFGSTLDDPRFTAMLRDPILHNDSDFIVGIIMGVSFGITILFSGMAVLIHIMKVRKSYTMQRIDSIRVFVSVFAFINLLKQKQPAISRWRYDLSDGTNENRNYSLIRKLEVIIWHLSTPLKVVAIVGTSRAGKSYLINQLTNSLTPNSNHCGFSVGSTIDSCTKGVWMRIVPCTDGHLLALDSEGLQDWAGDETFANKMYCLLVAVASTIILNENNVIKESTITNLGYVASLSSFLQPEYGSNKALQYPRLIFLIRDFYLSLTANGKKCTPDEYLEFALSQGANGSSRSNASRTSIRENFTDRMCVTVPKPVVDESKLQSLPPIKWMPTVEETIKANTIMDENFLRTVFKLKSLVIDDGSMKTTGDFKLKGREFIAMTNKLVVSLNQGETFSSIDAWEEVSLPLIEEQYWSARREALLKACDWRKNLPLGEEQLDADFCTFAGNLLKKFVDNCPLMMAANTKKDELRKWLGWPGYKTAESSIYTTLKKANTELITAACTPALTYVQGRLQEMEAMVTEVEELLSDLKRRNLNFSKADLEQQRQKYEALEERVTSSYDKAEGALRKYWKKHTRESFISQNLWDKFEEQFSASKNRMEEIVELMPREFTQIQFDLEQKLLNDQADEFRQAAANIKLQQIRKQKEEEQRIAAMQKNLEQDRMNYEQQMNNISAQIDAERRRGANERAQYN